MREKILELLKAQPFIPFRIYLSNGIVHVIRHPEQLMVGPNYLLIGIPVNNQPGPEISDSAFVTVLHVVQVEPFTTSTSTSNN
jgi:hypothetical protein